MKRASALVLAAIALQAATPVAMAQAPAAPRPVPVAEAPSDAAIRKWVEEHPDVIVQALNKYVAEQRRKEQADGDKATLSLSGELLDASTSPFVGKQDARITVAYVLDAECGYCKTMTPILEEFVAKNPDVRIVHRWVKFLAPSSEYAARVAALVWKRFPASYTTYYREVMGHKGRLGEEGVDKALDKAVGAEAGLQLRAEVRTGASRAEIDEAIQANTGLAHRAGIQGTPTFVLSGLGSDGILRGAQQPDALQAAIDKARGARKP
jgi:protein-disulfide isomerase